jgi:hypothetical protein
MPQAISPLRPMQFVMTFIVIFALLQSSYAQQNAGLQTTVVTVTFNNNHRVTGIVDGQSNAEFLWLRQSQDGIELCSGFAWTKVREIQQGNIKLTPNEFKPLVAGLATQSQAMAQLGATQISYREPKSVAAQLQQQSPAQVAQQLDTRVQSLQIHAEVANWDSDSQIDGLRVIVYPLNKRGELVPVRGEITFVLTGQFQPVAVTYDRSVTPGFRELEQISHIVREEDFASGPAVYQIPFSHFEPETEFNLVPLAIVTARLGVPTQGVFNATQTDVLLRNPSWMRDQLQYNNQNRFLPREK